MAFVYVIRMGIYLSRRRYSELNVNILKAKVLFRVVHFVITVIAECKGYGILCITGWPETVLYSYNYL